MRHTDRCIKLCPGIAEGLSAEVFTVVSSKWLWDRSRQPDGSHWNMVMAWQWKNIQGCPRVLVGVLAAIVPHNWPQLWHYYQWGDVSWFLGTGEVLDESDKGSCVVRMPLSQQGQLLLSLWHFRKQVDSGAVDVSAWVVGKLLRPTKTTVSESRMTTYHNSWLLETVGVTSPSRSEGGQSIWVKFHRCCLYIQDLLRVILLISPDFVCMNWALPSRPLAALAMTLRCDQCLVERSPVYPSQCGAVPWLWWYSFVHPKEVSLGNQQVWDLRVVRDFALKTVPNSAWPEKLSLGTMPQHDVKRWKICSPTKTKLPSASASYGCRYCQTFPPTTR